MSGEAREETIDTLRSIYRDEKTASGKAALLNAIAMLRHESEAVKALGMIEGWLAKASHINIWKGSQGTYYSGKVVVDVGESGSQQPLELKGPTVLAAVIAAAEKLE